MGIMCDFFVLQSALWNLEINDKVCIFNKNWPKRSEKSPNLPLKLVRKKSEFSIFESEFNSGSTG